MENLAMGVTNTSGIIEAITSIGIALLIVTISLVDYSSQKEKDYRSPILFDNSKEEKMSNANLWKRKKKALIITTILIIVFMLSLGFWSV